MYCGRLVGMVILIGWIWFLVVILIGISPVIIRDAEHIVLWQFGFFFLKGVREIYLLPLASLKLVVYAIYFCNICCRTFPEGGHVCVLSRFSHVRLSVTLWTIAHQATRPWDSPGKNTGIGCHVLLQGIFLTQGSNQHLYVSCIGRHFFTTSANWEAPVES